VKNKITYLTPPNLNDNCLRLLLQKIIYSKSIFVESNLVKALGTQKICYGAGTVIKLVLLAVAGLYSIK
jgi:hypothetical protein